MLKLGEISQVPLVHKCPHVTPAKGIVRMSSDLISALAAAVHDNDEWAIVCKGTRSEDGFEATVTSWRLPPQDRCSGSVDIKEFDQEPDDILVIHSHHHMGAFFSGTDENKLNPRFRISIVVAQKKLQYLGFDYKGTGKVTLPCGALGEIPFFIQPEEGPIINSIVRFAGDTLVKDLGDCPEKHWKDAATDQFHIHYKADCGLEESSVLRANAFGKEDVSLLTAVSALPRGGYITSPFGIGGVNKTSVMSDPDSRWCNKHKDWDFCEHNLRTVRLNQQVSKQLDKPTSTKVSARNPNPKGAKRSSGWLGKYEERFADNCLGPDCTKKVKKDSLYCSKGCCSEAVALARRQTIPPPPECVNCDQLAAEGSYFCSLDCHQASLGLTTEEKTINRYWCETCKEWDAFVESFCDFCATPWCEKCQQGHKDIARCHVRGEVQPDGCVIVM